MRVAKLVGVLLVSGGVAILPSPGGGWAAEAKQERSQTLPGKSALPDKVFFGVRMELGDVSAAREWLAAGLHPDFEADRIGSGLMIGAWEGNVALMEAFLVAGANIDHMNSHGEVALMHAAWKGRLEAVKWLVARGAAVNRAQSRQWTPLHYAVFAGHKDVAGYLVDNGADIDALSTNGSSVLMMAAREGQEELAKVLLEKGARTDVKNDWGDGAFEWAMRQNNLGIAKMVSTREQFAQALSEPKERWTAQARSVPLPEEMEDLLREQRMALARGESTDVLREKFVSALDRLAKAKPLPEDLFKQGQKQAKLEIRAKRSAPTEQSGELLFKESYQKDPFSQPSPASPSRGSGR